MRVCDAVDSPWNGVEFMGTMLDREAALAHPRIRDVFHITDHAVVEDRPLKAYLDTPAPEATLQRGQAPS